MNDEDSVTPFMPQSRILAEQYEPMMSDYLRCEKKREEWKINWIEWDAPTIRASARLEGWSGSKTDQGRFHLSIYSAREMDAQLSIISLHLRLGLSRKTAEVWLLKCTEECRAPITDPDDIRFERLSKLRKTSKGKVLTEGHCRISDRRGGEIVLNLMGLMEWRDEWGVIPNQF
jgi:hypothetical protein